MHLRNVHSCIQTEFVIDICTMLLLCQCIFVQTSHACVVYVMLCICKYVLCYGPVASISLNKLLLLDQIKNEGARVVTSFFPL